MVLTKQTRYRDWERMKIRYEVEIKNCADCALYQQWHCEIDWQEIEGKITETVILPCDIRPCPIEVKVMLLMIVVRNFYIIETLRQKFTLIDFCIYRIICPTNGCILV